MLKSFEGRISQFPMLWSDSGLHKIRLQVTDTEGDSSAVEERWVNVINVAPTIEPLDKILPIAEGQEITITGYSNDTESDISTLVKCWDIDPGIDSDDFGSAADDCDIRGDVLTYSWNRSGSHTIIYHVTDDDGAHSSEVLIVEVLNMPPKVRITDVSCVAYSECILDASATIDSMNDINDITIVWDIDITSDSNGDGIKDNDADLIGTTVSHVFRISGVTKVKAIAWDEDPERPGTSTKNIDIAPPERNLVEKISASLVGEEANAFAQLSLLVIILSSLALFTGRKKENQQSELWAELSNFQNELDEFGEPIDQMAILIDSRKPESPPPLHLFVESMETAPENELKIIDQKQDDDIKTDTEPIPIPEDGLPEGWSEEQWQHYGQQYLDSI
jgi:hypothetical protein